MIQGGVCRVILCLDHDCNSCLLCFNVIFVYVYLNICWFVCYWCELDHSHMTYHANGNNVIRIGTFAYVFYANEPSARIGNANEFIRIYGSCEWAIRMTHSCEWQTPIYISSSMFFKRCSFSYSVNTLLYQSESEFLVLSSSCLFDLILFFLSNHSLFITNIYWSDSAWFSRLILNQVLCSCFCSS